MNLSESQLVPLILAGANVLTMHEFVSSAARNVQKQSRWSTYDEYVKPTLDCIMSLAILIFCLPLLAVAMLAIIIESPGNPFYSQKRVGKNGERFLIYKLRSMETGVTWSANNQGSEITRVGRILRATKIDELPQLINILMGNMSIIGPRPLCVDEVEHIRLAYGFADSVPGFIPTVRPGLIGLEQLRRSKFLSYAQRFQLNAVYERKLSPLTDLWIFTWSIIQCRYVCASVILSFAFELVCLAK